MTPALYTRRVYPQPSALRRALAVWGALWAGWDRTEVALTLGALALLAAVVRG